MSIIIRPMSEVAVDKVRQLESLAMAEPQVQVETTHVFHAGVYCRTLVIPAGVMITGALVKIPTVLIVSGDCIMYGEGGPTALTGHHVFKGSAGRKQVFIATTTTTLTMLFATSATTVDEAEREFTDESHLLVTRRDP